MLLSSLLIAMPGTGEIILIVIVIVILFGGKKIPELMRGLGKGINEFKKAKNEVLDDVNAPPKEEPKKTEKTEEKEAQ